jgi:sporulation protein YlmC with PRC-barrel domain
MGLIRLRDSDLPRDATAKALLDGDLYDRNGEKIGTVKDLYVDTEDEDVRFLDVGLEAFWD